QVGLGTHHLYFSEQVVEERPPLSHPAQNVESFSRGHVMRERSPGAQPAGEHQTYLRPAEAPRNRADASDSLPRAGPISGTRAESRFGQLVDWRNRAEHPKERVVFVNQIAINRKAPRGEVGHYIAELAHLVGGDLLWPVVEFLHERTRERYLESTLCHRQQSE